MCGIQNVLHAHLSLSGSRSVVAHIFLCRFDAIGDERRQGDAAFHWSSIISIYTQNANTLTDAKATSTDTPPHLHNFQISKSNQ